MADVCVLAELVLRDGQTRRVCVTVDKQLSALINGLHDLNLNVSQLLNELVEREKSCGVCAEGEEEDDDDEDEELEEPLNFQVQPPAKRSKT